MRISQDSRYTSFTELVQEVGNVLFDVNARATGDVERDDSGVLNVRESANACLEVLPKLNAGLDVNCKFGGPSQFEYTQELGVFDLLDIGLYHGWVVGDEDERAHAAIAHLSYNQIVEKLIAYQELATMPSNESSSPEAMEEGALIAEFMDRTASQLSHEGLAKLQQAVSERQLVIFYRNGHFSTMVRYEGQLYLLCTDLGFATSHVIWERLDEVNGNTTHCDAGFQVSTAGSEEAGAYAAAMAAQEQMYAQDLDAGALMGASGEPPDADMLLALQLSQEDQGAAAATTATAQAGAVAGLSEDELLAMRLMEEQVQEQEQQQAQAQAQSQAQPVQPVGAQV